MVQLPRGVPFIDLLVPSADKEAIETLQTRLELAGGGDWRIVPDDGTMESSSSPMGPLRGQSDRVWAYRARPWTPGEPLQDGVSMAMELAVTLQASLAAFGVHGTYAWGLVLAEDVRWLHGLVLLDWLYNPRLSETGEILEHPDEPPAAAERHPKKLAVFRDLWTPQRSMQFATALPPGAVQQVEGLLALPLLGQAGDFDPRYWQGFALQLAIAEVQAHAAGAPPKEAPDPVAQLAPAPAPPPPAPEDDGLTPLARALHAAEVKAARAAAGEEDAEPEPAPVVQGDAVRWVNAPSGPMLVIPPERYDASIVRALSRGSVSELPSVERPSGQTLEAWLEAGAPFLTEIPLFSRLFVENRPLYKKAFLEAATEESGVFFMRCQLPRVSPVVAVLVPATDASKRRIVVCSDRTRGVAEILTLAP
jgi:hypothetical protein